VQIYDGLGNVISVVDVDTSLTKKGMAADAKTTGDRLDHILNTMGIDTSVEPAYPDIPVVRFTGTPPTTKGQGKAKLEIEYISNTGSFSEYCTLKVQGDSSAAYPKKNYNIQLFHDSATKDKDKQNFMGWGKTSKFCMKANWIDHTHARNVVNARLWGQMCATRSDISSYPAAFLASPNYATIDGFPVQVYFNDVYWGLYTWNMAKDDFFSNMDEDNPNNAMMIADDSVSPGVLFNSASTVGWTEELTDTINPTIEASWYAMQNFIINSDESTFKSGIENYMYLSSLIDRYIFSFVTLYYGGFAKSQAYYTYDGTKWLSAMYDLDTSWSLLTNGAGFKDNNTPCPAGYEPYNNSGHNTLIDKIIAYYPTEIKARYAELRQGVLSNENIVGEFTRFMNPMTDLYALDYAPTTGNGAFTNIPSKTTNTPEDLVRRINARLAYADTIIPNLS
jgi:hypothetical protein